MGAMKNSVLAETKSAKGAVTRDQILDAAGRLIHLQGYHCTSLDDVLRESGVGKGNFYYYFRSKEELGYAIIDRLVRAFLERTLEPAFADFEADPVAQIHILLDRVLDNQRQRNCIGGCPMGNLASEISDVHEGFRSSWSRSSSRGASPWRRPFVGDRRRVAFAPSATRKAPPTSSW